MKIVKINSTGRANLIKWVETFACYPVNAALHASRLIEDFDGSDVGATQRVELRGMYAADYNPKTYTFGPDELTVVDIDDDGNEIPAGGDFAEA